MASHPLRSCVSCRAVRSRTELVRVHAAPGGALAVDLGGGVGRGAYICPRRSCLEQAATRGEFARRLKVTLAPISVETLEGLIRERVSRKVVSLLGLARRARGVVSGTDAVRSALNRHTARLILVADDASANSVPKILALAAAGGATSVQVLGKEELGAAVGGAPRSCVAVIDPQFADAIKSVLAMIPMESGAGEGPEVG
ncbi:MAG: DUF448 domain-containing protein [Candidatus Methylomirabilis sp.]